MKLLISLGHNSSAILTDGYDVLCGYEEERLSKVKSDSSYPKLAIEMILNYFPEAAAKVDEVCVSHWFSLTGSEMAESKYWQPKHVASRFPNAKVRSLSKEFTHHDAHANSVWNFSQTKEGLTIVADGFGNDGETLSVYRDGKLVNRLYEFSVGLIYQYMTSQLGMKENQDEYKMLGLESLVTDYTGLEDLACEFGEEFLFNIGFSCMPKGYEVKHVCEVNKSIISELCKNELKDLDNNQKAYVIQRATEYIVVELITDYIEPTDKMLQFAGGIFYNVKLNNVILNTFAELVDCIEFMPIAGDQGAVLGMVPLKFDDFFWGLREHTVGTQQVRAGIWFVHQGNMEFGPRALGNTSCIAMPSADNVSLINKLNGRPDIMPMAPMISCEYANEYCLNISKLGKCKHFMICATDWLGPIDEYRGVLHKKPNSSSYTCRPQVIENEYTARFGVVINTSLNAHGQPILFDYSDYKIMERAHEQNDKCS